MPAAPRMFIRFEGLDSETVLLDCERAYRVIADLLLKRRERINTLGVGSFTYHCGKELRLRFEITDHDEISWHQ